MNRRNFAALLMGSALIVPAALKADDHDDDRHAKRYYDRDRKEWHEWNEREERAYRHWIEENHRKYHDWARANREEQREYWRWRHEHPE